MSLWRSKRDVLTGACVLSLVFLVACGPTTRNSPTNEVSMGHQPVVNIGILAPSTGPVAQFGVPALNGKLLYINTFNQGDHDFTIAYHHFNETGNPIEATLGYHALLDWGMHTLLGSVTSGATLAVVPLAAADNIPMMTATASAAAITRDPSSGQVHRHVFRTTFIDPFQGHVMASFAHQALNASRVAVLYSHDIAYSTGLMNTFVSRSRALGMEVVAVEYFEDGSVDFLSQLTNIAVAAPDVLFAPVYIQHLALIGPQIVQAGLNTVLLGADGWVGATTELVETAGLEGSFFMAGFSAESDEPMVVDFVNRFEATYGDTPNMFAALGYDAAAILIAAIGSALADGHAPDSDAFRASVIQHMGATNLHGVTGHMVFDAYNNPQKSAFISQIQAGEETLWGTFYAD